MSVAFQSADSSACWNQKPTYRHRLACRRYTSGSPTHTKPLVVFLSGAIPMRFFGGTPAHCVENAVPQPAGTSAQILVNNSRLASANNVIKETS